MKLIRSKLKELVYYYANNGTFIWKARSVKMFSHCKNPDRACNVWNSRFANEFAGSIYKACCRKQHLYTTDYVQIRITIKGKTHRHDAHRLAWLYVTGEFPINNIDHIDGNGLNNRFNNLRDVTTLDNSKNQRIRSDNTSGFTGVVWHIKNKKWQTQISITDNSGKRKCIYGGQFCNLEDAIQKRKQMNIEYGFHKNHGIKKYNY